MQIVESVPTDLYKVCVSDNSLPGLTNFLSGLTLLPNSGATDIVFVTLFRTAVGTVIAWYVCTLVLSL